MKKYLIYTLLAFIVFSGCKKNNTVAPEDLPEKRIATTLAGYSTMLTGNADGWKAVLNTAGGGVYLFSFKFGVNNRVTMLSDINATSSTVAAESSYIIKQQQTPSLLFDTYNYLHLLADPDPSANGGVAGAGLSSDIEYRFDTVKGDTINLIGDRLGSKLQLIKATAAADYTSFVAGTVPFLNQLANVRTYFKRIVIGGADTELRIDGTNKVCVFSTLDPTGNLTSVSSSFYIDGSTNNMIFLTPVVVGTATVSSLKDIAGDAAAHVLKGTVNGTAVQMRESITPLKLDVTSPQRWYAQMNGNPNGTWITGTAFHFGVDDYCGFKNVANYSSLWYAGPTVFGGTSEGLISLVNGGLANPYVATRPFTTPAPGIGRFTILGNAGTFTGTAPLAVAMTAARQLMFNGTTANSFQDWYFVQTNPGGTTYDMVRVSDAQVWLSWKTL